MNNIKNNNDVDISQLFKSLISNFKSLIIILISFFLIAFIAFQFLNTDDIVKKKLVVKFYAYDLEKTIGSYKSSMVNDEIFLNLNNELESAIVNLNIVRKERVNDDEDTLNLYGFFRVFSDILQKRTIYDQVSKNLFRKKKFNQEELDLANVKLFFKENFSLQFNSNSEYVDFLEISIESFDREVSKAFLDEYLLITSKLIHDRISNKIKLDNQKKLDLLKFKITSLKTDINLIKKFFETNYSDYVKFLKFNLKIAKIVNKRKMDLSKKEDETLKEMLKVGANLGGPAPYLGISSFFNTKNETRFDASGGLTVDFESFKNLTSNQMFNNNPLDIEDYLNEINTLVSDNDIDFFIPGLRSLQLKLLKANLLYDQVKQIIPSDSNDLIKSSENSFFVSKNIKQVTLSIFFLYSFILSLLFYVLLIYVLTLSKKNTSI